MDIKSAAEAIKIMYRTSNSSFDSGIEVEQACRDAIKNFNEALSSENDPNVLEECVICDPNWEISVDERLDLLRKTKNLGASSMEFLIDYYGYLAGHLDPGPEKDVASSELNFLLDKR